MSMMMPNARACALILAASSVFPAAATQVASKSSVPANAASAPASTTSVVITLPAPVSTSGGAPGSAPDAAQDALLTKATDLMKAGQFETAIAGPIDAVIASFESRYGHDSKTQYYSVRSQVEALLYMAMAAKNKQNAEALGPDWQAAYFLKGSALNSLGHFDEASNALQRALALAPMNAQTMIELAFSYEHQHKTADALDLCENAEAMSAFSPADLQQTEKTRALRCEGYNLTNLQRYSEAVQKYDAALKLNPDDAISKHELEYIRQQQALSAHPQA